MRVACLVAVVVAVSVGGVCRADTLRWVNAAGGSFADGGNWDLGRVPGSVDLVVFDLAGTYTVTLPANPITVTGVDVVRGAVTLAGPGTLRLLLNAPNHRLSVGLGTEAATLVISNLEVFFTAGTMVVADQGTLITRSSGSLFTTNSILRVVTGGLVRMESGSISPETLRFEGGRGEAVGGLINGDTVVMLNGSEVLVSGTGSRFTCEAGMTLGGSVRLEHGGVMSLLSGGGGQFTSQGCHLVVGDGGTVGLSKLTADATTVVLVESGGNWSGGTNSEYHGPFTGLPGSTVTVSGSYYVAPAFDEAAVNQQSGFVAVTSGLTTTIDPLIQPATPILRRLTGQFSGTYVGGVLTVNVRNPNVLRVGDVFPILERNAISTGQFTALATPELGGGRTLEMFEDGSPVTTYVRVIAAAPSCYTADFDGDGNLGTDSDIAAFFACLCGQCCTTCATSDFNGDGDLGTDQDIEAFFRVLGGGPC